MKFSETKGDIIKLAKSGRFTAIAHGSNCFHTFGSGVARQIRENFYDAYKADLATPYGDINKLGTISSAHISIYNGMEFKGFDVLNCYIQHDYGTEKRHVDYDALRLCMKKINHEYKGDTVGLPLIGCGTAGGDWTIVKDIITQELKDLKEVVIVHYEK